MITIISNAFFLFIFNVNMNGNKKICDMSVYFVSRAKAIEIGVVTKNRTKL